MYKSASNNRHSIPDNSRAHLPASNSSICQDSLTRIPVHSPGLAETLLYPSDTATKLLDTFRTLRAEDQKGHGVDVSWS